MRISRPLATGSTIATFFIVAVTGVLLFFHIGPIGVEWIHEWVGIVMVVACALHIVVNLTPFKKFFRNTSLYLILASFAASVLVVVMMGSGNPKRELFEHFKNASLNHTMEYLGTNKEKFAAFLAQNHVEPTENMTFMELVKKHDIGAMELMGALLVKD
ncbi:MAG: DUF4405 domain-containing protein [Helicobacter sp.]|nr:DUF4405 domain-containing protein [Helicobacter sp.]